MSNDIGSHDQRPDAEARAKQAVANIRHLLGPSWSDAAILAAVDENAERIRAKGGEYGVPAHD